MSVAFELIARARVRVTGDIPTALVRLLDPASSNLESARAVSFARTAYPSLLLAAQRAGLAIAPVPPCVLALVPDIEIDVDDEVDDEISNATSATSTTTTTTPQTTLQHFDYERDVDVKLRAAALPYQVDGIRRGLRQGARVFFADEMGLGKTLQALGVLSAVLNVERRHSKDAKALILCPTSLTEHWVREVTRWTSLRAVRVRDGKRTVPFADADVVVGSVDLLKITTAPAPASVLAREWAVVVCDESHGFKNKDTARARSLVPLMKRTRRLVLISGTPQLAMPCDLFVQMDVLLGEAWMPWKPFTIRYCEGHIDERYGCWDARGAAHTTELALVLDTVMVRRLARDVLTDLPPLTRDVVRLTLPPQELLAMRAIELELDEARAARDASGGAALGSGGASRDQKRAKRDCDNVKALTMRWWRETAIAKQDAAVAYIKEEVSREWTQNSVKSIVFIHHETMRSALMLALGNGAVDIHGGTPAALRQGIIDRVASSQNKEVYVAVLSITACSTGLSVVPAVRRVLFAESNWNPSLIMQAEKRAHRIGCTGPVRVTFVQAIGTIDSYIEKMNAKKAGLNIQCIGSGSLLTITSRSERAFRGNLLIRYGVVSKCASAHPDTYPNNGETQGDWIKRTCIPLLAEDTPLELLSNVEPDVFALNILNYKWKQNTWRNIDEWTTPSPLIPPKTFLWLLINTNAEEIIRIKAIDSPFERSIASATYETCAVFAK